MVLNVGFVDWHYAKHLFLYHLKIHDRDGFITPTFNIKNNISTIFYWHILVGKYYKDLLETEKSYHLWNIKASPRKLSPIAYETWQIGFRLRSILNSELICGQPHHKHYRKHKKIYGIIQHMTLVTHLIGIC